MTEKDSFSITDVISKPFLQKDVHGAIAMPVYNTAAFEFDTAEEMEDAYSHTTRRRDRDDWR